MQHPFRFVARQAPRSMKFAAKAPKKERGELFALRRTHPFSLQSRQSCPAMPAAGQDFLLQER